MLYYPIAFNLLNLNNLFFEETDIKMRMKIAQSRKLLVSHDLFYNIIMWKYLCKSLASFIANQTVLGFGKCLSIWVFFNHYELNLGVSSTYTLEKMPFRRCHICDLFYHYELHWYVSSGLLLKKMSSHMSHICDLFDHYALH